MTFQEQLNIYMEQISCSAKELSKYSGLSPAVISRYRNGTRLPRTNQEQIKKLSEGLYELSQEKGTIKYEADEIYKTLSDTIGSRIDISIFQNNLNILISTLNINLTALSNSLGFSPSLISKIKSGKRNPAEPLLMIEGISKYIVENFNSYEDKKAVSILLQCPLKETTNDKDYHTHISNWLANNQMSAIDYAAQFLNHLDDFNMQNYIKSLNFDNMQQLPMNSLITSARNYYGISEMKQAEISFFIETYLADSNEPIFMCSNMPMADMSEDMDFTKNYILSIAMNLKKGHHFQIIHNVNRPFNEMMLGLEGWIPLYMTGQVFPYYIKNMKENIYCQINYLSGQVALTGECIQGNHDKGKCYLTKQKEDIDYMRTKAQCLMQKAEPLMKIYRNENKTEFLEFIRDSILTVDTLRRILPSPPLHTAPNDMLLRILKRNQVPDTLIKNITKAADEKRQIINTLLKQGTITDDMEILSQNEFEQAPPLLFLADTFFEQEIAYTYEEYLEHIEATQNYAKENPNYNLVINNNHSFRNIQISISEKNFVMISKNTSPAIHFVIRHPHLRSALENYIPPIVE